jgi:hypothetical protein
VGFHGFDNAMDPQRPDKILLFDYSGAGRLGVSG